jgi:hypothetical protein
VQFKNKTAKQRAVSFSGGNFSYGNDLGDLFDTTGTNVFLVKVSRWFSL